MLEFVLILLTLFVATIMRPWRLLAASRPLAHERHGAPSALWTPLLASLVILPWLWALPTLHQMPLQLQWSSAVLVMMMLGWPLAVPVLCAVGAMAYAFSPALSGAEALRLTLWHGIAPASFAMLWGALLRHWLGTRVFVYIFGRGFVGTVLSLFLASSLSAALGHRLPGVQPDLSAIAHWLMAWGDAIVTGMLCAVLVAYRPQWLATWSDELYLYSKS